MTNFPEEENTLASKARLGNWPMITILMAIAAEILQTLLAGRPASLALIPSWNVVDVLYFAGAFAGVPACVLWIGAVRTSIKNSWQVIALAFGFVCYAYQMTFNKGEGLYSPSSVVCLILGPLGLLVFVGACVSIWSRDRSHPAWIKTFFRLAALLGALTVATNSGLHNNRLIYPITWDYFAYRIDAAFHGLANSAAIAYLEAWPSIQSLQVAIYGSLILIFYALVGVAIRKDAVAQLNVWRVLIVPFILAFFLYAFLPLSGPAYAFFSGEFPLKMPLPADVISAPVVIPPAYRNGMPSMHLTGALLAWMLAVGLRSRVAILGCTFLVIGTAWATLATGEHYVIDLVVALPYAAFLGTALIWPSKLSDRVSRSGPIWGAGGVFLIWLALIRWAPHWLGNHTEFVLSLSMLGTALAAAVFYQTLKDSLQAAQAGTDERVAPELTATAQAPRVPAWIIAVFVVSGLAGLVYEVVYAKALAITFGSTALASYTVLATYMGGMAIGAYLGGMLADRIDNPLKGYAACEAAIGAYAALTPKLFALVQAAYVALALDAIPDAPWLSVLRVGLGGVSLGIPTILMGATLPLMFKYLRSLGVSSHASIAPLYGANVAGAALGSMIAGYWLLPAVGRDGSTYLAAVVSLLIALYVMDRIKRLPAIFDAGVEPTNANLQGASFGESVDPGPGKLALLTLLFGGAVTLGSEVNSMHLLAVVAGNSVYAFGLMLAAFLGGLAAGSYVGERAVHRAPPLAIVGWAQCGIALAIAVTSHQWNGLPSYFSSFGIYPVALGFGAREAVRAIVCLAAMLPVAFFIGVSYPAAMSLAAGWISPRGSANGVGIASAVNTLGNILGVLLVGFWLLPGYGSRDVALVLATIALVIGAAAIALEISKRRLLGSSRLFIAIRLAPIAAGLAAVVAFPPRWDYDALASGGNVYFSEQSWGNVIAHAESVDGGITSVAKNDNGVLTLLTNGKFQGNNSPGGEMVAQESFALLPLLHTPKRDSALVIGYGTGMTTKVLHDSGFKSVDVAELSKDIVALADTYFADINHRVTSAAGVHVHYTDGRNFLLTQTRRFDLISIEVTSIWFAGAANLYNQEFYALAKKRLNEAGVLQQWIQLHHITPVDIAYVLGSLRSEFQYV
ncbi:MAG: phosphatase PAP2 family protein, partial [Gammaproteobacteria bacterium]|nr:phosphatase PAP2 family protein [Gammaproteobacteria bacterium]